MQMFRSKGSERTRSRTVVAVVAAQMSGRSRAPGSPRPSLNYAQGLWLAWCTRSMDPGRDGAPDWHLADARDPARCLDKSWATRSPEVLQCGGIWADLPTMSVVLVDESPRPGDRPDNDDRLKRAKD